LVTLLHLAETWEALMTHDMAKLFALHERGHYAIHRRHLNEQMVRVLKAIGYDIGFCSGKGQYLYDRDGNRYLDLLSGFGVFAIGRNHPALCEALKSVLDSDLPNLVEMDVSTLAGILAGRLLAYVRIAASSRHCHLPTRHNEWCLSPHSCA
jgi:ornithine--oxo-acid transaminase